MVRQTSMLLEADLYARTHAARTTISGVEHRTSRHIWSRHAWQRARVQLMMGGLTSTVVGMMYKDAANVSTTAGGLEVVALVDLL